MFEDQSNRSKIIAAAMRLAETRGWRGLSLGDIADGAGLNLVELRREFGCKAEILMAFRHSVDDAVLARSASIAAGEESARDRLFDVLMTRFEIMTPYRPAIKRIVSDLRLTPASAAAQALSGIGSHYWMLEAAHIDAGAPGAALRIPGLALIYAQVFGTWLGDEDPGLARTMAALDRRLSRAEGLSSRLNELCEAGEKMLCALAPRWKSEPKPEQGPGKGNGGAGPAAPVDQGPGPVTGGAQPA